MTGNLLYAQSGGVTAVINASAAGVISEARVQPERIERVLAARNGILGVLRETLVDTAALSGADLARLRTTPGGAFGSCRFDLDPAENNPLQYDRLFDVLAAHDIRFFLYNGGNGSMETCRQIQSAADARLSAYCCRCTQNRGQRHRRHRLLSGFRLCGQVSGHVAPRSGAGPCRHDHQCGPCLRA